MARRSTRMTESRSSEERAILDQLSTSPLHIPEHEIPDGMEYSWVRETVVGQYDEGNVTDKTRLGWRPVPADRHPSAASGAHFPGMKPTTEQANIVRYRGLVLCERPAYIGEAIRNARMREQIEIMQSTPGMEGLDTGYVRENRISGGLGRPAEFPE
jgi:hypothetical protein